MKNTFMVSTCLFLALISAGCYPVAQTVDAFRSPNFRPDATFKVVSLNTNDRVLIAIEQQLLSQGFKVIADNYLRSQAVPVGNVAVTMNDTTYNTMQYRPAGVEIFKEKPTDYVVRYEMAWRFSGSFFEYFNASVVNTASGLVEFTYNFRQGFNDKPKKDMGYVLNDFVRKMRASQ